MARIEENCKLTQEPINERIGRIREALRNDPCPEPVRDTLRERRDRMYESAGRQHEIQAPPEKPKEIQITALDRGYLVRVGCQQVAVESLDKLLYELSEYLRNPSKYEREFMFGHRGL